MVNLSEGEINTWRALARLMLRDPIIPSFRDIALEAGCVLSTANIHMRNLERLGYVVIGRDDRGHYLNRSIVMHIWPSDFGIGANKHLT